MLVVQASSPAWLGAGQRPAPQHENGQPVLLAGMAVSHIIHFPSATVVVEMD